MAKLDREPASRWFEIPVGAICTAIGAVLLVAGAGVGYEMVLGNDDVPPLLVAIVLAIGLFLGVAGIRLLTGRQRKGGGLLSPTVLRLGGVFFMIVPVLMFFEGGILDALGRSVFALAAATACFALAARRSKERIESSEQDA